MFAPVLITVYDRLEHLKLCIESLKKCSESQYTSVYIASDYAARPEHEALMINVREYIKSIDGFNAVIPVFRERNIGGHENGTQSLRLVFETSDTVILMEDDVLVGKGFLKFMNDGLVKFKSEPSIIGVCGYLPPEIENDKDECFFLQDRAPYGFGMWRDKETNLLSYFRKEYIEEVLSDFDFFKIYEKKHPHSARALPLITKGDFMPGDIVSSIIMQKHSLLSVYPPTSLTATRGNDGSGLHSGVNIKLQAQKASDNLYDLNNVSGLFINTNMEKVLSNYYSAKGLFLINYLIYFFCRFPGGYPLYKLFRNGFKKVRKYTGILDNYL